MNNATNPRSESNARHLPELQKAVSDIIRDEKIYPDIFNKWPSKWKNFWTPFSSWKNTNTKYNDCLKVDQALDKIEHLITKAPDGTLLPPSDRDKNIKNLQNISIAAKNRAEVLTDKADYYPVYAVVVTVGSKLLIDITSPGTTPRIVDLSFSIISVIFVFAAFVVRVNLKREIAFLKICSNLLDAADKRFANAASKSKSSQSSGTPPSSI